MPGVLAYGSSSTDAMAKAEVLALRVIADQLENGESQPISISVSLPLSAGRTYSRMNQEGSEAGPMFTRKGLYTLSVYWRKPAGDLPGF